MAETTRWWVGIDWAMVDHQVCVLDGTGREVTQRVVAHTAVAVRGFVDWLRAQVGGDLATVAVGIETPRGALVATLMEQGLAVYAVNPKQLDRFRDRHTVAGAKDDRRDARVLADSLRDRTEGTGRADQNQGRPAPPPWCPRTKKRIRDMPGYTEICRDIVGYSGMGPRRLRPMIVGVPLEPGVGGMGGAYDIDAEGVDGGGPDPIGDGVVADGAGAVDAASPAGVCGVKAFGDLLGEGPGIGPAGGVVADLGGDLARHRPHRRHLDPARRSARRGRFITPRL